jgi:hypothetical protein
MKSLFLVSALSAGLIACGAYASEGKVELNDLNKANVVIALTGQGYEVGKIKIEDGYYEAYTRKDGKKLEVFLDSDFKIVKVEEQD